MAYTTNFDLVVEKNLDLINIHVCGELSKAETSNGFTDLVLPEFGAVIAGLSSDEMKKLMNAAAWTTEVPAAMEVLTVAMEIACARLAEKQAINAGYFEG